MADRISDSRQKLYAALAPLMPEGRVSKYVPAQVVSPTIWIERHSWARSSQGAAQMIALSWRIVVATDADDDQARLDELSSLIHDTVIRAGFRPLFADFQSIDIGGANTTALVVTVEQQIAYQTLCLPIQPALVKELIPT